MLSSSTCEHFKSWFKYVVKYFLALTMHIVYLLVFVTRSNTLWKAGLVHQIISKLWYLWYLSILPSMAWVWIYGLYVGLSTFFVHFSKRYWYWLFGIVIGIMVLVFWVGTSCMRTWHVYGLSIGLSANFGWYWYFCLWYLLLLVSWYWYFGLVLLAWGHGMGMACPSDYQALSLFTSYTKACALCSITSDYITLHYTKLHA